MTVQQSLRRIRGRLTLRLIMHGLSCTVDGGTPGIGREKLRREELQEGIGPLGDQRLGVCNGWGCVGGSPCYKCRPDAEGYSEVPSFPSPKSTGRLVCTAPCLWRCMPLVKRTGTMVCVWGRWMRSAAPARERSVIVSSKADRLPAAVSNCTVRVAQ
jgi:hypothetical protein